MTVATDGNLENLKALILAGADINARDKNGKTALKLAIENNRDNHNKEIIDLLKSHGAVE